MVLYKVEWIHSNILSKGKGKLTKNESYFVFTVLCRNSTDAHRCLNFYFDHQFVKSNKHSLCLDDGEIRLSRMTIDSRGFYPHYLMLDGMREPIYLTDVSSNLLRANNIFGVYGCRSI